jgi:hypothetical protein
MAQCKRCGSDSILSFSNKTSDRFHAEFKGMEHSGYVLSGLNIGGQDYLEIDACMQCGQIQGEFPVQDEKVHGAIKAQF